MNQSTDSTNQLIRRAQEGDSGAVERLFAAHRDYLHRLVTLRMEDDLARRVDASDVVQEAQLRAHQRLTDYLTRPELEFRLWLRGQALDRMAELRRFHVGAKRRAVHRELQISGDASAMIARQLLGNTPSQSVIRRETVDAVQKAIMSLRAQDRELILLRHFEGLSNQEAAQLLNIEPAAASKRLGRALLTMHQELIMLGVAPPEEKT